MASKFGMLLKSTDVKWILVIILFFIYQKSEATEECDIVKCIGNTRSFISGLRKAGTPFLCKKFPISGCSDHCLHKYYPNIVSSDVNLNNFTQYCTEHTSYSSNANWSCIARHSFRFLTCLTNVSSLVTNNVHEDAMVKESCRKALDFKNCPSEVLLSECGEKSVEVVKDMLQFTIDYFMPFVCKGTNVKDILSIPVHYYFGHEFMEVARCFDTRQTEIDACFSQLIQDEIDLQNFICGKNDDLSNCIQFQVNKTCKGNSPVRTLLLKSFLLGGIKCDQSLTSYHSEDTRNNKFALNNEMNAHSDILNDKVDNISELYPNFPEISTSQMSKNKDEAFHRKNLKITTESEIVTESPDSITHMKIDTKEKNNHNIQGKDVLVGKDSTVKTINDADLLDISKTYDSSPIVKNSSKKLNHKDSNYFNASKGICLHNDRTLCTIMLLIVLVLKFKIQ